MSSANEEIIRRAYRRAEDKDIVGWVNSFTPRRDFHRPVNRRRL
jgi:hypothetical protein